MQHDLFEKERGSFSNTGSVSEIAIADEQIFYSAQVINVRAQVCLLDKHFQIKHGITVRWSNVTSIIFMISLVISE